MIVLAEVHVGVHGNAFLTLRSTYCGLCTVVQRDSWTYVFCIPGAQFTKYLTIYRKIIVRSTYDNDLQRAKTSFRDIVS